MAIPFVSAAPELNKSLKIENETSGNTFRKCLSRTDGDDTLPGQPRIRLRDTKALSHYLYKEHSVNQLDRMATKLWLVSTPNFSHISSLHHQAARGRNIIVVEEPHLHLVWYYDRIFIKPIPPYLLSHAFWKFLAETDLQLWRATAGFLRSYSFLVQYEVDFVIAQRAGLIPKDDGSIAITFNRFVDYLVPFMMLEDSQVNARYQFGELRLMRLNMLARVMLGKLTFYHIDAQWGAYLNHFVAPFLTVFLILTTILAAMQVELAVQGLSNVNSGWWHFARISQIFSVTVVIFVMVVVLTLLSLWLFMFVHDIYFARSVIKSNKTTGARPLVTFKSGVV